MPTTPDDLDGVPAGSVGTLSVDAPVTRAELERAVRRQALALESLRDDVIQLTAHLSTLTAELDRRIAGVEPAVEAALPGKLDELRARDEGSPGTRVLLGDDEDKYATAPEGPDCAALLPICRARCCRLHFALSTQDLDEGVVRWDYGRPYSIRQRIDDGYCVHNHPVEHGCTVYARRPGPCRRFDCRDDPRIWADFSARVLADESPFLRKEAPAGEPIDLVARSRARQIALAMESFSIATREAERGRHERRERYSSCSPQSEQAPRTSGAAVPQAGHGGSASGSEGS